MPGEPNNITIQYNIMAESSTGTTAGNTYSSASSFSYLRNMFSSISHRFPACSPYDQVDIINNVVHNWSTRIIISPNNNNVKVNTIGNYWQRGQVSTGGHVSTLRNWVDVSGIQPAQNTSIYSYNNFMNDVYETPNTIDYEEFWVHRWGTNSSPSYSGALQWDVGKPDFKSSSQFALLGEDIPILSPQDAKTEVQNNAGANASLDGSGNVTIDWDAPDDVYRSDVINNTYTAFNYPIDPTGYNHYTSFHASVTSTPINSRASDYDTDNDGMPNAWELLQGLDPNNDIDGAQDINGDGYTNLEDYLNQVDF